MAIIFRILCIVSFCFLYSCISKNQNNKLGTGENGYESQRITDSSHIIEKRLSKLDSALFAKLGILEINKDTNDLELRIWYGDDLNDSGKLIIMMEKNVNWDARIYTFRFHGHNQVLKSKGQVPISGWNIFVRDIENLGIYHLQSYSVIKQYNLATGGDQVTIEMWRNGKTFSTSYPCFSLNTNHIDELQPINKILALLEREFSIKFVGNRKYMPHSEN